MNAEDDCECACDFRSKRIWVVLLIEILVGAILYPENHCSTLDLFVDSLSSSSEGAYLNVSFTVKNPCLLSSVSFKYGFEVELLLIMNNNNTKRLELEEPFMSINVPLLDLGRKDEVSVQAIFNSSSASSLVPLHHLLAMDNNNNNSIWRTWASMNFQLHVHALVRQLFSFQGLAWWSVSCGDLHTVAYNITQHGFSICNSNLH
ncbi:uncharacterized protein G2W53_028405 [Senna tora]|uniref:Uncharacterized protein n=1 Tax=Senna tora TaxID=362788 RepID=A0A834T368_9FABA|nr:uncharacterized protein G2W53_028405 [Senna tora]